MLLVKVNPERQEHCKRKKGKESQQESIFIFVLSILGFYMEMDMEM